MSNPHFLYHFLSYSTPLPHCYVHLKHVMLEYHIVSLHFPHPHLWGKCVHTINHTFFEVASKYGTYIWYLQGKTRGFWHIFTYLWGKHCLYLTVHTVPYSTLGIWMCGSPQRIHQVQESTSCSLVCCILLSGEKVMGIWVILLLLLSVYVGGSLFCVTPPGPLPLPILSIVYLASPSKMQWTKALAWISNPTYIITTMEHLMWWRGWGAMKCKTHYPMC